MELLLTQKTPKSVLRRQFLLLRDQIPLWRRREASKMAYQFLSKLLCGYSYVCSFMNKKDEIDLMSLNTMLAEQNRLLLPKVLENSLQIYKINNLTDDIEMGIFSVLQPKKSCLPFLETIPCILVPGIAFDARGYRLGSGFGFYDRLLQEHEIGISFGIGFLEQKTEEMLSIEGHDQKVSKVYYF